MKQLLKVLLVQRRPDRGRLRHTLQRDSGLQFKWQRVFSEHELRTAAREYAPAIVLSADDMHCGSAGHTLDMLHMLSKQPPEVLIHEVCDDGAPWSIAASSPAVPKSDRIFLERGQPVPAARPQLPVILRDTIDAVLMLDGDGWVTDLNPLAQRLLGIGVRERPKAQAHLQDLISAASGRRGAQRQLAAGRPESQRTLVTQ